MTPDEMHKHADKLAKLESALNRAVTDYSTIKALNGQIGYAVTINGVRVDVADMDRYYNGALIRGREMIHLGCLKALDALVDKCRADVIAYRALIASELKV